MGPSRRRGARTGRRRGGVGRPVLPLRSRRPLRPRAELGPGMASGCQDRGVGVVARRLSSPSDGNLPRQHPAASSVGRGDPRARETRGSQSRWLDQLRGEPESRRRCTGAAGRRHAHTLPSGRCAPGRGHEARQPRRPAARASEWVLPQSPRVETRDRDQAGLDSRILIPRTSWACGSLGAREAGQAPAQEGLLPPFH